MKILVLTGSPRKQGTTARLAEEFIRGAREAGHEVLRMDAAQLKVGGCLACRACRSNGGACVQKDDMYQVYPHLVEADGVVLVTPLYYYAMTGQLKTLMDRFFAVSPVLRKRDVKLATLAACEDDAPNAMDSLRCHHEAVVDLFGWEDKGMVLALDALGPEDLDGREELVQAYELGKIF